MPTCTPENFKCTKCGECCRMIVKLSANDITQIESIGKTNFTQYDEKIKSNVLKHHNNKCIFLQKNGSEFVCSIYKHRPKVCVQYPFIGRKKVEDCHPPRYQYWPKIEDLF